VRSAVSESVRQQTEAGIDIVNDGEMSKVSYSTYVNARLTGFEGHVHVPRRARPDAAAFPRYAEWNAQQQQGASRIKRFACMGPVTYVGQAQLATDIEDLNHAVANIPADRMRLHLCWGNYEGPHHLDVPLKVIIGEVFKARPVGLSFEGANPRHEHEWAIFEEVKLPPDKVLIPGVLDTTTNYIEHPELVAQRLVRYARLVGRENIIAGADCGFGTFAGTPMVHPDIVFAKLKAMVDGASIATHQLWG